MLDLCGFLLWIAAFCSNNERVLATRFYRLSKQENLELSKSCGLSDFQINLNSTATFEKVLKPEKPQLKLALGVSAKSKQFPWALKIYYIKYRETDIWFEECSGTLISYRHAITSAECFAPLDEEVKDIAIKNRVFAFGGSPCVYAKELLFKAQEPCESNVAEPPSVLTMKSALIPYSSVRMQIALEAERSHKVAFGNIAILELEKPADPAIFLPICIAAPELPLSRHLIMYAFGRTELEKWDLVASQDAMFIPWTTQLHWYLSERVEIPEWMCQSVYRLQNCQRFIITINTENLTGGVICYADSGGGLSTIYGSKHYLLGVIVEGTIDCPFRPQDYEHTYHEVWHTSMLFYGDFLCYYVGICPLGYEHYNDINYYRNPEPVFYLTGKKILSKLVTNRNQLILDDFWTTDGKNSASFGITITLCYQLKTITLSTFSIMLNRLYVT